MQRRRLTLSSVSEQEHSPEGCELCSGSGSEERWNVGVFGLPTGVERT